MPAHCPLALPRLNRPMTRATLLSALFTAMLLALGLLGGFAARSIGAPMPFMLGALAVSATLAAVFGRHYPRDYRFPQPIRLTFIAIIGVTIGAKVSSDLLSHMQGFLVSLVAVSLFVVIAQVSNAFLFRRLGGLDDATAWFSASPGGLVEAVTMGEAAGGDLRMMTLLQFLRIILVVSALPIALSIWNGAPVGSAAGLSLSGGGGGTLPLVLTLAAIGHVLGRVLHLPAGQLTGPLIAAALLSVSGAFPVVVPGWLVAAAQVVLGVHLGVNFHGVKSAHLLRAVGLSIASVSFMLALGFVLAIVVHAITGLDLIVLIISYAPGGVTEMGLVAISLAANPTLVTLHHLFRITLTVVFLSVAGKKFNKPEIRGLKD